MHVCVCVEPAQVFGWQRRVAAGPTQQRRISWRSSSKFLFKDDYLPYVPAPSNQSDPSGRWQTSISSLPMLHIPFSPCPLLASPPLYIISCHRDFILSIQKTVLWCQTANDWMCQIRSPHMLLRIGLEVGRD